MSLPNETQYSHNCNSIFFATTTTNSHFFEQSAKRACFCVRILQIHKSKDIADSTVGKTYRPRRMSIWLFLLPATIFQYKKKI